jgi:hypothetical protein
MLHRAILAVPAAAPVTPGGAAVAIQAKAANLRRRDLRDDRERTGTQAPGSVILHGAYVE